jgi:hypothetical protein
MILHTSGFKRNWDRENSVEALEIRSLISK